MVVMSMLAVTVMAMLMSMMMMLAALTSNLDLWPPTSSTGPNFRSSSSPRKCVGWKIVFLFPLSFPLCAVLYTNSSETLKVTNHGGKLGAASNGNSHISESFTPREHFSLNPNGIGLGH